MPRAYSPDEAERIRQQLIAVGRERFSAVGLKKVTIGELTRAVGIGTGSFYLFFGSKEALFFSIQEVEEQAFKHAVEETLHELEAQPATVMVEAFLRLQLEMLDRHPFLRRLIEPDTVAHLMRRVDPQQLQQHREADARWLRALTNRWVQRGILAEGTEPDALLHVSTALFALSTQAELIGESFPQVKERLVRALAGDLLARR